MPAAPLSQPRTVVRRSQLARDRLLEAGLQIFGKRGLDGTSVREIATASGQNVASISYHFGSKEGLYFAVLENAAQELLRRAGGLRAEVDAVRTSGNCTPEEAKALIQRILRTLYLNIASREDSLAIGKLVVREQMEPTQGFEILFRTCLGQIHEALGLLLSKAVGVDPNAPETIIRAHTLLGQVFSFRVARETIRRRLGWKTMEGKNAELVAAIIEENVALLLDAMRRNRPELS